MTAESGRSSSESQAWFWVGSPADSFGVSLQSDETVLGVQPSKQAVPATTDALAGAGPSTDIEAVRAQRYAPAKAEFEDIEALRAQRYEAPAPTPVDIEALRAQRYARAAQLDIEAIRAQRYESEN